MKSLLTIILSIVLSVFAYSSNSFTLNSPPPDLNLDSCTFKGFPLVANVQIVEFGSYDFTVRLVETNPDVEIIVITHRTVYKDYDDCLTWRFKETGSYDYTIKIVESNPDLNVRLKYPYTF